MPVKLTGIQKSFSRNGAVIPVLRDIDLEFADGEFVCLVGPSGCGKSTLLNVIAGLDRPDSGRVEVDGRTVERPGSDRVMVFQEAALFPWLTVQQNVEFGLTMRGERPAVRHAKAQEYLKQVYLSRFAGSYPHELSGGMKQRAAIARCLVMDPTILLMDEPFGALDEQTRTALQSILQQVWLETHKTVIFVTHSLSEAVLLSDRVVLMTARPGSVLDIYPIPLPHPRDDGDPELLRVRNAIRDQLVGEIEKVEREEMDSDWTLQTPGVLGDSDWFVGDSI